MSTQALLGFVLIVCATHEAEQVREEGSASSSWKNTEFGKETQKELEAVSQQNRQNFPEDSSFEPASKAQNQKNDNPSVVPTEVPYIDVDDDDEESRLEVPPSLEQWTPDQSPSETEQQGHEFRNRLDGLGCTSTRTPRLPFEVVLSGIVGALNEICHIAQDANSVQHFRQAVRIILRQVGLATRRDRVDFQLVAWQATLLQHDDATVTKIAQNIQVLTVRCITHLSRLVRTHPSVMKAALDQMAPIFEYGCS